MKPGIVGLVLGAFVAAGALPAQTVYTNFMFSVDLGSDMSISDPFMDGDEILDPGDIYFVGGVPQLLKNDFYIFGYDPPPPAAASPFWVYSPGIETNFFDMDGEDQLTEFIEIWEPMPVLYPPLPPHVLLNPSTIYYSIDDDDAPGWYAPAAGGTGDVPVLALPDTGPATNEIVKGQGWFTWPSVPGRPVIDEAGLGMAPDPFQQMDDDDVDALDNMEGPYWYWSVDHEATLGLLPANIYVTDLSLGLPNYTIAIPHYVLGLPVDADVDAFEFLVTDDPDILGYFGIGQATSYLAVAFSVDEDDPLTQGNESAALNPNTIYISLLTGSAPYPLSIREDDVDGITFGEEEEEPPQQLDYGDAWESAAGGGGYPTYLASDGARHSIVAGVLMGTNIDAETDGQPNAAATGDDIALTPDDEDGVGFPAPLYTGGSGVVDVYASVSGYVSAWVDFNQDFDWADAGEQILNLKAVTPGLNSLGFSIPASAKPGTTYGRFRFVTNQVFLSYTGAVNHGEVEDHALTILEEPATLDFGDATDTPFPTLLASDGARHFVISNVCLGTSVDAELDGQPDGTATGDDLLDGSDDEDGLTFPSHLLVGQNYIIPVVASVPGFLNGWVDFMANGNWSDPGEQVWLDQPLVPGLNMVGIIVPPTAAPGGVQARFRFTTNIVAGLSYTGYVDHGEVEDYELNIMQADFGDAPATYPTAFGGGGAYHLFSGTLMLGSNKDAELDGQPGATALNDDTTGSPDDEDGIIFETDLVRGSNALVSVWASGSGYVHTWIDFNRDGDWNDPGEKLVTYGTAVTTGSNAVPFTVPAAADVGQTYARFRLASTSNLAVSGASSDGEVEDYAVTLYQPHPQGSAYAITNCYYNCTTSVERLNWASEAGMVYQLQVACVLPTGDVSSCWTDYGPHIIGPTNVLIDSSLDQTVRMYRLVMPYLK